MKPTQDSTTPSQDLQDAARVLRKRAREVIALLDLCSDAYTMHSGTGVGAGLQSISAYYEVGFILALDDLLRCINSTDKFHSYE